MLGLKNSVIRLSVALLLWSLPLHLFGQDPGTVEGRVTDVDGQSASGADVRISALSRLARTEDDGTFSFADVPPGRYVIEVLSEAEGALASEVVVTSGETTFVEVRLDPLYRAAGIYVSVAGEPVTENDLYQAASALSGRDLRAQVEPTLGETLARQPGVTSSYFGPGSSRPVIRGLSADRVRILEAGVGTGDASTVSTDHAVSVESQLADRIEVIRGPATLLYGSSAIGGVVNVLDRRVPDELPPNAVTGELMVTGGTVANERNVSSELNGALGRIGWHLSGLLRDTEDYEIPGHAVHDEEGETETGEDHAEGILLNSALETGRGAAGLSYVGTNGFIGASYSGYDTKYGVPPGGHVHEEAGSEPEEGEEELVSIDLEQRRFDVRGGWRFGEAILQGLSLRLGVTDYQHTELEGGTPGTVFDNEEWEARLEVQTQLGGTVHGAAGVQFGNRDFAAVGEEAFTPPTDTDQLGVFAFQEVDLDPLRVQLGARFETRGVSNNLDATSRDFDDLSFSGGFNWAATERIGVSTSVGRSVKFPSAEELFSDGPHLASLSFEVGNPDLRKEEALNADVTLRVEGGRLRGQLGAFVSDFSDFVFQEFTGQEQDGLPVRRYTQGDAVFTGLEGNLEADLATWTRNRLSVDLTGDWVRAELSDTDSPLPLIPPGRIAAGLALIGSPWEARVGWQHVTDQTRVAPNEEPTDGYTMLDARISYRRLIGETAHELSLQGRNLTNEEARNHVSLIKESAPLPGRELRLVYRLAF